MKRNSLFAAMCAAFVALASCDNSSLQPQVSDGEQAMGQISISISPDETMQTKAVAAYTTAQTYESQVNKIQLFVFDSNGDINIYKDLGTTASADINTTQGSKTVWAVVNGPSLTDIKTLTELKAKAVDLSENSTTAATGFVMTGSKDCTVGATAVPCEIKVSRLAARVALVSVKNDLPSSYGALQIERVWLSNVVGNQSLDGTAEAATWYNKEGRMDEETRNTAHIIDGTNYTASLPSLTFKSLTTSVLNGESYTPSTPDLFYCYANESTTAPNGFSATFAAQRTVLVVAATVNEVLYYYPVVLKTGTITRNTAHTVAVTITGLGSDDPNKPVDKGSINVSITVDGWDTGAVYEETI